MDECATDKWRRVDDLEVIFFFGFFKAHAAVERAADDAIPVVA